MNLACRPLADIRIAEERSFLQTVKLARIAGLQLRGSVTSFLRLFNALPVGKHPQHGH